MRELILPWNVRPSQSGKLAMSRGMLTSETLFVSGSTLTTTKVSVSAWSRPFPESIPVNRTLIRAVADAGVASGVAWKSCELSEAAAPDDAEAPEVPPDDAEAPEVPPDDAEAPEVPPSGPPPTKIR